MKDMKELLNFGLINFDKPAGSSRNFVSRGRFAGGWSDASMVGRFACRCLGNFYYSLGDENERH
ncbi:MAG TPA: hypothetical protein ENH20_01205 [Candidatus Pacearchaeota archaeon]|nr:hypothetical protein [Candidatus Pacearchaeota archaeon]